MIHEEVEVKFHHRFHQMKQHYEWRARFASWLSFGNLHCAEQPGVVLLNFFFFFFLVHRSSHVCQSCLCFFFLLDNGHVDQAADAGCDFVLMK